MKDQVLSFLQEKFPQFLYDTTEERNTNIPYVFLKAEGIVPALQGLKTEPSLGFEFLNDITVIDWLGKKPYRFEVFYLIRSPKNGHFQFQIKVPLEEGEIIPSITPVFKSANWPEREAFDLFGIEFSNHPLLDRIIMPDNFVGHPLRKDYPLEGFGQDYLIQNLLTMHVEEDIQKESK